MCSLRIVDVAGGGTCDQVELITREVLISRMRRVSAYSMLYGGGTVSEVVC